MLLLLPLVGGGGGVWVELGGRGDLLEVWRGRDGDQGAGPPSLHVNGDPLVLGEVDASFRRGRLQHLKYIWNY